MKYFFFSWDYTKIGMKTGVRMRLTLFNSLLVSFFRSCLHLMKTEYYVMLRLAETSVNWTETDGYSFMLVF